MEKRVEAFAGVARNKLAQAFAERLVEGCRWNEVDTKESAERCAKIAYLLADAILAEGAK